MWIYIGLQWHNFQKKGSSVFFIIVFWIIPPTLCKCAQNTHFRVLNNIFFILACNDKIEKIKEKKRAIQSEEKASVELARTKAWDIVPGQVFAKLEVYKVLAKLENEKHCPYQLVGLPDPSVLSVWK